MTGLLWAIKDHLAHNHRIRVSGSLILPRHTWRAALVCVLLVGLLFAAAISASAHAEDKPTRYTINVEPGSVLNFRAAPSTDAEILYQLGPGNTVTLHETSGDWALVTWTVLEPLDDPRAAWVCMDYLTPAEEQSKEAGVAAPTSEPLG